MGRREERGNMYRVASQGNSGLQDRVLAVPFHVGSGWLDHLRRGSVRGLGHRILLASDHVRAV